MNRLSMRSMTGFSLVELMVSMALGLFILTAVAVVFANASNSRNEIERVSRQIENGRYAVDLLSQDLRLAGFYGELNGSILTAPAVVPDPCSTNVVDWNDSLPVPIQAYDGAAGAPATCLPAGLNFQSGTDILVIRRARTCAAGVGDCPAATNGKPYVQVSMCRTEATTHVLGLEGTAAFNLTQKDCTTAAAKREYYPRIYFVSADNGVGQNIPTLKRLEYDGAGGWATSSLIEGIEQLNFEYGLDTDGDGTPDVYVANPNDHPSGCNPACQVANWMNVVAVQMHVLSRNLESSAGYTDPKTYHLGELSYTPTETSFRRHAYSTLVRLANPAGRRDLP